MANIKKPTHLLDPNKVNNSNTNNNSSQKNLNSSLKIDNDGFKVVDRCSKQGKFREGSGKALVRILVKGTKYKVQVVLEENKEIYREQEYYRNTLEYSSQGFIDDYSDKFKEYCEIYLNSKYDDSEEFVLCKAYPPEEFNHEYGGTCIIRTYFSSRKIRCIVTNEKAKEIHREEIELIDGIDKNKQCKKLFLLTQKKYTVGKKFPKNIAWLDNILKKFPLYGNKPIYSFWLFILSIIVGFILFLGLMGLLLEVKAKEKNAKKISGKEMQNSFFDKSKVWILNLEEPIFSIKETKCKETRDEKSCNPYCYHRIIGEEICKDTGYPWAIGEITIEHVNLVLSSIHSVATIPIPKGSSGECNNIVLDNPLLPTGHTINGLLNILPQDNTGIYISLTTSMFNRLKENSSVEEYRGSVSCIIDDKTEKFNLTLEVK